MPSDWAHWTDLSIPHVLWILRLLEILALVADLRWVISYEVNFEIRIFEMAIKHYFHFVLCVYVM